VELENFQAIKFLIQEEEKPKEPMGFNVDE
jgi:hypothetical protein